MEQGAEMQRELTGRMVFAITASAFAVIIGVNVLMAVKAVRTFPGLEVKSSYVASQTFDAERRAQEALGWGFSHSYERGVLSVAFTGPDGAPADVRNVTALVGRTTEARDDMTPAFQGRNGSYEAAVELRPGRWMVMLNAEAADGTTFRKRFDILVKG
jgi:nitrogen fixation protein FixH